MEESKGIESYASLNKENPSRCLGKKRKKGKQICWTTCANEDLKEKVQMIFGLLHISLWREESGIWFQLAAQHLISSEWFKKNENLRDAIFNSFLSICDSYKNTKQLSLVMLEILCRWNNFCPIEFTAPIMNSMAAKFSTTLYRIAFLPPYGFICFSCLSQKEIWNANCSWYLW